MDGEFSGRMGHVVAAHPGNSGGNERPKRKMMPREGERRGAGRKPGGEEHRHVVGEASKVLRLIAFARQGVEKDAHSVVSK